MAYILFRALRTLTELADNERTAEAFSSRYWPLASLPMNLAESQVYLGQIDRVIFEKIMSSNQRSARLAGNVSVAHVQVCCAGLAHYKRCLTLLSVPE